MEQRAAPYVLASGQARSHPGAVHTVKAGAADTGGLFTFCEDVMAPRTPGPALHVHEEEDECFYVLDGHLLVQVGEERHDLGPGCFAWLPPGSSRTPSPTFPTARCTWSGRSCPAG